MDLHNDWIISVMLILIPALQVLSQGAKVEYETVCQWENFNPRCGEGEVIVMQSALYGRMRSGPCIDGSTNGCSSDVLDLAHQKCSGRQTCDVIIPDPDFARTEPCGDLKNYFEGSYKCVAVLGAPLHRRCTSCDYVPLTLPSGYIAKQTTISTGCGSLDCPWLIQAKPGQRITMTLHDFTLSRRPQQPQDVCEVYAVISEPGLAQSATICGGSHSSEVIYVSTGSKVTVRIMSIENSDEASFFMLNYKVEGCPDIIPPQGGWLQRAGDAATIGCHGGDQEWKLKCNDTAWIGAYQNCTDGSPDSLGSSPIFSFSYGETIAIIISIALVIGVLTVMIGIICLRRAYTPSRQPIDSNHSPYGYNIETLYNTPTVPYYHSHHPNAVCHEYQEVGEVMSLPVNKSQPEMLPFDHRANDYIRSNRPLPQPGEFDLHHT